MNKTTLKRYARLIAQKGVNIKKGQEVVIRADLDQPEFITILTEECYKAGAGRVTVELSHQPITKLGLKYRTLKSLSALMSGRWKSCVTARKRFPRSYTSNRKIPTGCAA